jgi:hypothetical protein
MGHYSDDADSVRVDFFKPSCKWYTTEAIKWTAEYSSDGYGSPTGKPRLLHDIFSGLLLSNLFNKETQRVRLAGMWAVCLDPYHEHTHPLMIRVPGCYWCGLLECNKPECEKELKR